ncbi:unnamed protein product [Meloidogyne enterolobii]|uniref:Uncharacterized protein n=1 Tax=Meloidogyne enterolobii TaxID=390850 RepID=A0ACB1ABA2_MELEN
MLIAASNFKLLYLKSNMPGSVNDARVLSKSSINDDFENGFRPFPNAILIGDSIYPSKDWLIPMRARANERFKEFYEAHARTRSIIERTIGLLKMRWLCLKKGLRVKKPSYSAEIVKCCGYLHNFIIDNRQENEDDDECFDEDDIEEEEETEDLDNFFTPRLEFIFKTFIKIHNK